MENTFKNRPYPLCDKPINDYENQKKNKGTLTRLFKGFGEAYKPE